MCKRLTHRALKKAKTVSGRTCGEVADVGALPRLGGSRRLVLLGERRTCLLPAPAFAAGASAASSCLQVAGAEVLTWSQLH